MLLHQRRRLAVGLCLFVDLLRLNLFLDPPFDEPVADAHPERIDRRILRQREGVNPLNPAVGRVAEPLGHNRAGDGPGDVDLHVGGDYGGRDMLPRRLGPEQQ